MSCNAVAPDLDDHVPLPLRQTIMADPVQTADGETYERSAIERWLTLSVRSPKTNLPLENRSLIPNMALRNLIADFLEARPQIRRLEQHQARRAGFNCAATNLLQPSKQLLLSLRPLNPKP